MSKICVIHGHPDTNEKHFVTALGQAYVEGATSAGHTVSEIRIGDLNFDLLRRPADFETLPSEELQAERQKIAEADHVVLVFPLWLGGTPAIVKAFFEQIARGGYFLQAANSESEFPIARMKGKSLRIIVTMGMPGLVYKTWFGAHSLKGFEQGIFGMSGFKPIHHKVIGTVGVDDPEKHEKWLSEVRELGTQGK